MSLILLWKSSPWNSANRFYSNFDFFERKLHFTSFFFCWISVSLCFRCKIRSMFTITSLFVRARNSVYSTCSVESATDQQRSPTPPYVVSAEESPTNSYSSSSDSGQEEEENPSERALVLHFPPPPAYPPPPIPPNTPRRVRFSFDPPETPPLAEPELSLESTPELRHHPPNLFSIRDVIESDESGFDDSNSSADEVFFTAPGTPDSGSWMGKVTKKMVEKSDTLLKEVCIFVVFFFCFILSTPIFLFFNCFLYSFFYKCLLFFGTFFFTSICISFFLCKLFFCFFSKVIPFEGSFFIFRQTIFFLVISVQIFVVFSFSKTVCFVCLYFLSVLFYKKTLLKFD